MWAHPRIHKMHAVMMTLLLFNPFAQWQRTVITTLYLTYFDSNPFGPRRQLGAIALSAGTARPHPLNPLISPLFYGLPLRFNLRIPPWHLLILNIEGIRPPIPSGEIVELAIFD